MVQESYQQVTQLLPLDPHHPRGFAPRNAALRLSSAKGSAPRCFSTDKHPEMTIPLIEIDAFSMVTFGNEATGTGEMSVADQAADIQFQISEFRLQYFQRPPKRFTIQESIRLAVRHGR